VVVSGYFIMNIHKLLELTVICTFCFACKEPRSDNKLKPLSVNSDADRQSPVDVVGDWERQYPYATYDLSLLPNGSFKFQENGCTGTCYSEGIWKQNGMEITLQSDNKYNSSHIDSTKHTFVRTGDSKNSKQAYFVDSEMLNKPMTLRSDSTTIYFSNKRLAIRDGTLAEIDSDNLDSIWIYKKKNNR